ncbi:hypothetical protein K438DRAFT_1867902 [Mycena galopus ATCC 62051]|nr:hypothetical protein K438DRAFT_1867902 [Mycena galopus ATCC 62051]
MSAFVLPPGASYVAGVVLSTVVGILRVRKFRGLSGIKYPRLYAYEKEVAANPNALKFNCAQREYSSLTLITALKYPVPAASVLGVWSLACIGYTVRYTTGDPKSLHYSVALGLLASSKYTVVQLILAKAQK